MVKTWLTGRKCKEITDKMEKYIRSDVKRKREKIRKQNEK